MYISANVIHVYESAYKLIDDNTTSKEWEYVLQSLPKDESGNYSEALDVFENLEDEYETYNYILLDFEHVVMVFNGDVVREWETVAEFIQETIEQVKCAISAENEDD